MSSIYNQWRRHRRATIPPIFQIVVGVKGSERRADGMKRIAAVLTYDGNSIYILRVDDFSLADHSVIYLINDARLI